MKIDVLTYHEKIYDRQIAESTVLVIDVLRCTSAIINAFDNGAARVIPFIEPGDAIALATSIGRNDCVVGGERGCNIVPGFDVGNSPFEYSREKVEGKTVIVSTSNGTNAICGTEKAKRVFLAAMSNSKAAAAKAIRYRDNITIVCSGTNGMISADDCVAAGSVIANILNSRVDAELTDFAMICVSLYYQWLNGEFDLLATFHCNRLINLGYGKDVEFCLTENTTSTVPEFSNGVITA